MQNHSENNWNDAFFQRMIPAKYLCIIMNKIYERKKHSYELGKLELETNYVMIASLTVKSWL